MSIRYPTMEACRELLFPLIRKEMMTSEPAPHYLDERRGIDKLQAIFDLMQRNEYEGLYGKAAYLFCSIIDGHPFSNGNKRLAVAVLTFFLVTNHIKISAPDMVSVQEELHRFFPHLKWEEVHAFHHSHEYFFYHLALIVADRAQKGQLTFRQEQDAVRQLLEFIAL